MFADGISTVASSSPSGDVAVWDLDRRRLASVIRSAHHGPVTGLQVSHTQKSHHCCVLYREVKMY